MDIILLAFCCASISFTISVTSIFEYIREKISLIHPVLEELIHCPWCLNHYITLAFLILTKQHVNLSKNTIIDGFITWMVVVGISGIIHYILLRAYEPVAKNMLFRKQTKTKQNNILS